jgi:hypothetical protein
MTTDGLWQLPEIILQNIGGGGNPKSILCSCALVLIIVLVLVLMQVLIRILALGGEGKIQNPEYALVH